MKNYKEIKHLAEEAKKKEKEEKKFCRLCQKVVIISSELLYDDETNFG